MLHFCANDKGPLLLKENQDIRSGNITWNTDKFTGD